MSTIKDKFKPAISRELLILIAGLMWCSVGIMLLFIAYQWLSIYEKKSSPYILIGIIAALIIHHFGFLKIVNKNLDRISKLPQKACAFSFISWKSYFLIFIMVSMGIILRHSPLPKQYLSIIYIGIGIALFLSSLRYFRNLFITDTKRLYNKKQE